VGQVSTHKALEKVEKSRAGHGLSLAWEQGIITVRKGRSMRGSNKKRAIEFDPANLRPSVKGHIQVVKKGTYKNGPREIEGEKPRYRKEREKKLESEAQDDSLDKNRCSASPTKGDKRG